MNKNRMLSLILSVMMIFTLIFPMGAIASEVEEVAPAAQETVVENNDVDVPAAEQTVVVEPAAEEPAAEEPAVEEPATEEPATEEPAVEETVSEEAANEAVPEEETPAEEEVKPFEQGYVRVNGGTIVYANESKQEEKGSFTGSAVVYAAVSSRAADEAYSWLRIVFDTAEAKEAGEGLLSGYVQFKDVTVLSDEAVEQLTESLKNDYTVRSYGDKLLPLVPFAPKIEEITEIVVVEFVEEETIAEEALASSAQAVSIQQQPLDSETAVGDMASFSVEATGVASYQWQYSMNGGKTWHNNSGDAAKTATFSIQATEARYGYKYRCKLTGADGTELITDVVAIVEPAGLEIVTQPVDSVTAIGDMASFCVEATGVANYQWQYSMSNGKTWYNNSGDAAKTATFSIQATEARYGYKYRCKLTGADGDVLLTDVVAIVMPVVFEIVNQPLDSETAVGDMASFCVEATGVASYQWQYSMNGGSTWRNNTGDAAKTATFSIQATEARYGYKYRCKLTGADGNVLLTDVVAIVKPVVFEIVNQPLDSETAVGDMASFSVEATGVASYQWQYSMNGGKTWHNNSGDAAKTATFSIQATEARYGYKYRCKLTGADGTELITDVVAILSNAIIIDEVTYKTIDDSTCMVVSYAGSASSLIIPESIEHNGKNLTVVEIGTEAFMNNTILVSIDLPDTITVIRARAFKGCSKLSDMH